MKKAKIIIPSLIVALALAIGLFGLSRYLKSTRTTKESVPVAISIDSVARLSSATEPSIAKPTPSKPAPTTPTPAPAPSLPKELNLAMTFYSQAPFADWSEPWQNACEESSALLVANAYYKHNWTREEFRDQILALVDWENKTFGDYKSTDTKQIVQMLQDVLKLKSTIHYNPSFADVQDILAQGHLIVIPLAGKELGNPFFTNGGPDYHVLVIKGYKAGEKVITEDVGTQHGENYVYSWKTIMDANHDYTTPIDNGAKMMIEVLPPVQK